MEHYMRSSALDVMPPKVKRSLASLGKGIATARRKRALTVAMMAERMSVSKNAYLRVEKGDPTVSLGIYAMALFVLGLPDALGSIIDPARDEIGLTLDEDRLPKRVRLKKSRSFT
jgi:DNA-binding XRE family transcriptional regulator